MENLKDIYIRDAKLLAKDEFIQKYNHPFLIQYSESSSSEQASKKMTFSTISVKNLDDLIKQASSMSKKVIEQAFPIAKSDRNPFAGKITVGRTNNHDLIIQDASISKFQGYFETENKIQFTFVDKGSTNGTTVNGEKLEPSVPRFLKDRDLIVFSTVKFTYYSPRAAYEAFKDSV